MRRGACTKFFKDAMLQKYKKKERLMELVIVGRPNVGKSTFFNRLVGKKKALVSDVAGMTRDRKSMAATLHDLSFTITDTPGTAEATTGYEAEMEKQLMRAATEGDILIFVLDGIAGVTPQDEAFAVSLRKLEKPIIVAVNKMEREREDVLYDVHRLGFDQIVFISAAHGQGMDDFYFLLKKVRDESSLEDLVEDEVENKEILKIAVVGRPNAGKSTFINGILKDDRLVTGEMAGVTRDSIEVPFMYQGRSLCLVDTAGIRRKAKISSFVEKQSVSDSLSSIQYAQVVLLMVDATLGIEKQDLILASHVVKEGRCLIIVLNKWDLVEDELGITGEINRLLQSSLSDMKGVSVLKTSALHDDQFDHVFQAVFKHYDIWNKRINTGELNRWLAWVTEKFPPPLNRHKRRIKLKYMTQAKTRPPTFIVFSSTVEDVPKSYERYLVNSLREDFQFEGVPIRLSFKGSKNPYAKNKK